MDTENSSLRFVPDSYVEELDPVEIFGSSPNRLEIDLGSGKGRFLLARAAAYPDVSFLGIDRSLERIEKVDRKARQAGLTNTRLFYMEAYYAVRHMIPANSVSTYYVLFPDPWPKLRHHGRRLFDPEFIDAMIRTMTPGAELHVATDHLRYLNKIAKLLDSRECLNRIPPFEPREEERTDFELIFLGQNKEIGRCSFRAHNHEKAVGCGL